MLDQRPEEKASEDDPENNRFDPYTGKAIHNEHRGSSNGCRPAKLTWILAAFSFLFVCSSMVSSDWILVKGTLSAAGPTSLLPMLVVQRQYGRRITGFEGCHDDYKTCCKQDTTCNQGIKTKTDTQKCIIKCINANCQDADSGKACYLDGCIPTPEQFNKHNRGIQGVTCAQPSLKDPQGSPCGSGPQGSSIDLPTCKRCSIACRSNVGRPVPTKCQSAEADCIERVWRVPTTLAIGLWNNICVDANYAAGALYPGAKSGTVRQCLWWDAFGNTCPSDVADAMKQAGAPVSCNSLMGLRAGAQACLVISGLCSIATFFLQTRRQYIPIQWKWLAFALLLVQFVFGIIAMAAWLSFAHEGQQAYQFLIKAIPALTKDDTTHLRLTDDDYMDYRDYDDDVRYDDDRTTYRRIGPKVEVTFGPLSVSKVDGLGPGLALCILGWLFSLAAFVVLVRDMCSKQSGPSSRTTSPNGASYPQSSEYVGNEEPLLLEK